MRRILRIDDAVCMHAKAIDKINAAKASAQQALDLLAPQTGGADVHLPMEDLRIAIRFLALAGQCLAKP